MKSGGISANLKVTNCDLKLGRYTLCSIGIFNYLEFEAIKGVVSGGHDRLSWTEDVKKLERRVHSQEKKIAELAGKFDDK